MTLGEIILQALRQLDEDPEDVGEYHDLFRAYANMGLHIAVREQLKPRRTFTLAVDGKGKASIRGYGAVRIVRVTDEAGREVWADLDADGQEITILRDDLAGKRVTVLAETDAREMETDTDVPPIPEYAHPALCDYICYRHLSNGNMAKQQRAQFYLNSFYQQIRAIRPEGTGSVTRFCNLYAVTSAGYRG